MQKKELPIRLKVLCGILAVIFLLYSIRLIDWQFINNEKYTTKVKYTTASYTPVQAARGEILDRYGRPFAKNNDGYNIVFDASYVNMDEINTIILKLCSLLQQSGEEWNDSAPLDTNEPYGFIDTTGIDNNTMFKEIGVNSYATAENCFNAMVEKYKLEEFSRSSQRIIMGVRLTMEVSDFAPSIPFTFAENVSIETVTKIKESSSALSGVFCEVAPIREYVTSEYATHLIGNIGPIYAEEWDELSSKGYSYNDLIGKAGIEQYCEDYLRGQNGTRRVLKDSSGTIVSEEVTQAPVSGNAVYLTLDYNLQKTCYETLKQTVYDRGVSAGAMVVLDVNTGETLASVTYPSYDIETYKNDYSSLLKNSAKPLFNRALNGGYAPGSTFKPSVACAGLQTGNITKNETIFCSQVYRYFRGYTPSCLGYHGAINVIEALKVSCNYFFFEVGRRVGIENMNKYCRQLGLGVSTGIELNESTGILAGKEYRESINSVWNEGDVIQAAIGQSDNMFTPIQLATYISTLANGGTRYKTHLIKEIKTADKSETVFSTEIEVMNKLEVDQENIDTVKEGMLSVTTEGTASIFSSYPIKVGGKTGTATIYENGVEYNNALFVAFAPYENPEIAVVIVCEKGGHGSEIAKAAKNVFDTYFYYSDEPYNPGTVNTLLK